MITDTDIDSIFSTSLLDILDSPESINSNNKRKYEEFSQDDLLKIINDFSESIKARNKCISVLAEKYPEELIEVINRFKNMYSFSASSGIEKTLLHIIIDTNISLIEKYQINDVLIHVSEKILGKEPVDEMEDIHQLNVERYFTAIKSLNNIEFFQLATPCKLNVIFHYCKNLETFEKAEEYFHNFISQDLSNVGNRDKSDDFKYKSFLSLESRINGSIKTWDNPYWKRYLGKWITYKERCVKEEKPFILDECADSEGNLLGEPVEFVDYCIFVDKLIVSLAVIFLDNENIGINNKILCAQNILTKAFIDPETFLHTQQFLLDLLNQDLGDQKLADIADILLKYGDEECKEKAQEKILTLGFKDNKDFVKTVYNNAQNIHTEEISESALEILEFLSNIKVEKIPKFKEVYTEIRKLAKSVEFYKEKDDRKKIKNSLNRIFIDRALYSKMNYTLENILIKVWLYINSSDFREEMIKRLLEELIDMSGWCSSGAAFRLLNILSGFGEFNMRVSWADQIIANFSGRFHALVNKVKNEEKKGKIVMGFTLDPDSGDDESKEIRNVFRKFFMKKVPVIREEMYGEFKEYISDEDFDFNFRKAIMQVMMNKKFE
jgi:hypothetical protein